LPQEYSSRSFENFKCYNNELKTAVNKLRAYKGGLCALLSPITGCGKTHLAIALARMHYRNLIYKWIDEKLESGEDFGDKNFAVNEFNKYSVLNEPLFLTEAEAFRMVYGNVEFTFWIKTTRLVIIDDVFSSRVNENTRSAVYELINTRVTNYRLDTVITSNLYINEIADIDPRIASRIQGDFTFELRNAVDYRGR
jgi:DNA replication protein DnaC